MNKTDAEWQVLDTQIARKVLGWKLERYNDAPTFEAQRMAWFVPVGKERQSLQFKMWKEDWQPHRNVVQAMLVLKTLLVKIGRDATAEISMRPPPGRCRVTIQNWVVTDGIPAMFVRSPYMDNEMQAICLTVEKCLDAIRPRMPDWAAP